MNHIHRLQSDLNAARTALRAADEAVRAFKSHLLGAKFQGCDAHGERKDWIATSDAFAWLQTIADAMAAAMPELDFSA